MKITEGYASNRRDAPTAFSSATPKSARTIFSPSPIHLLVSDDALMLKNVHPPMCAIAFPSSVFPVPGGPNSSSPRGAARSPVNRSGRCIGHTTASSTHCFACASPAAAQPRGKPTDVVPRHRRAAVDDFAEDVRDEPLLQAAQLLGELLRADAQLLQGAAPRGGRRAARLPAEERLAEGGDVVVRGTAGGRGRGEAALAAEGFAAGRSGGKEGKKGNFSGAAALPNLRCWSMRYWLRAEMKPPTGGFAGGSVEGSVEDEGSNGEAEEAEEAEEAGWRELSAFEMVIVVNVFGVFIVFVAFMGFIAFIVFAVFARFMELVEFDRL